LFIGLVHYLFSLGFEGKGELWRPWTRDAYIVVYDDSQAMNIGSESCLMFIRWYHTYSKDLPIFHDGLRAPKISLIMMHHV